MKKIIVSAFRKIKQDPLDNITFIRNVVVNNDRTELVFYVDYPRVLGFIYDGATVIGSQNGKVVGVAFRGDGLSVEVQDV